MLPKTKKKKYIKISSFHKKYDFTILCTSNNLNTYYYYTNIYVSIIVYIVKLLCIIIVYNNYTYII